MKRSELREGAELFYAAPRDWRLNYDGEKVTVVATGPMAKKGGTRYSNTRDDYVAAPRGNDALVMRPGRSYGQGVGEPYLALVRLGDLRGPWAETEAIVKARREQARDAAAQDARRRERNTAQGEALAARARAAGVTQHVWIDTYEVQHFGNAKVRLSAADFVKILYRLERAEAMLRNLHAAENPGEV